MYHLQRKRGPSSVPIPFRLALEIAFLPRGLSKDLHREEVKRLVRQRLPFSEEDWEGPGLVRVYDDRVHDIIAEVTAEN